MHAIRLNPVVLLGVALLLVEYSANLPLKSNFGGNFTGDLLSVVVLYRHGDRAPSVSFPNDPYFDETFWPMGYGQLTVKGKARLYRLGKWLRNRYISFLPQKYAPGDIYVRSTNIDRCLMSAAAALAGLYPPEKLDLFNPDLQWQPIPIHTESLRNDDVLSMRKDCKKYKETLQRDKDEFLRNTTISYSDFFDYVSKHAGLNKTTMNDIKILHTVLESYTSYNFSFIPPWTTDLPKKTLLYLAGLAHGRYTHNLELKRLLTGPFWYNLLAYFDEIVNGGSAPKLLMLSAHDTTIASLLSGMGLYDMVPPVYGATLLWELKKTDSDIYVRVSYRRRGPLAKVLAVKGCEVDCKYNTFRRILEPITIDSKQWELECRNEGNLEESRGERKLDTQRTLKENNGHKPFFID